MSISTRWRAAQLLPAIALVASACSSTAAGGSGADAGAAGICPGVEPWPAGTITCRTAAECPGGPGTSECTTSAEPLCGTCQGGPGGCTSDDACEKGTVCGPGPNTGGGCSCGSGYDCIPRCTATTCGPGEICRDDGHCTVKRCGGEGYTCPTGTQCKLGLAPPAVDPHGCEPISCADGYACPKNQHCQPGVAADEHGCVALTCASDADCDCGACVGTRCSNRMARCRESMPP